VAIAICTLLLRAVIAAAASITFLPYLPIDSPTFANFSSLFAIPVKASNPELAASPISFKAFVLLPPRKFTNG